MLNNELYRKLVGAKTYLDERIQRADFCSQSCVVAIANYRRFVQYLIDHFSEIEPSIHQSLFVQLSTVFIPSIRYIERASTANIPWSILPYLDQMLRELFGDNHLVLFRPQWNFNYTVMMADLVDPLREDLIAALPSRRDEIEQSFRGQRVHVFSFPYLEKTNVLLHSVIGHEIGHFYYRIWEESSEARKLRHEQNASLSTHYRRQYPRDMMKAYNQTEEGMKVLEGMYREIFSDICGYQLFGPSMLFALEDIAVFEASCARPSSQTHYYPPTKYRIRLLYEKVLPLGSHRRLLLGGNTECSKYFAAFLESIASDLADREDLKALADLHKETQLFQEALPAVIDFVRAHVPTKYVHVEIVPRLFDKLNESIPINELDGEPVGMSDIILAGWIFHRKITACYQKDDYITQYQILSRLLLKSLYSSYIHADYIQWRRSADGYPLKA
ncbi:MAG: hypothetical protein BWY10_01598 [Chloroflexi bacterium ADurb.Bin180]|nr:MAG: hypothetical protein BWY10_01598 [Chloroflexi bacterium ADurb.Bin180]